MEKKSQIYRFIESEIARRGLPPTIREIGKRFNISSTNGVRYFLERLERDGLIERVNRTARGIRIVEDYPASAARSIPLLGRVPAGKPDFSEANIEDRVLIDGKLAKGDDVFAVRVKGDSMIGAGINDGDIAVVKRTPNPHPGDIVVAMIDDEVTLKRYFKRGSNHLLRPENDNYPEINLSSLRDKQISILGTVTAIVRKY